jgi:glycosyltransferase involved in cell wall biosynthesis
MNTSKIIFLNLEDKKIVTDKYYIPLVSFVIPTLNNGLTLRSCLQSIVKQDYPSIEIIVVDRGSSDNSLKIAKEFGARILSYKGPLGDARQLGIDNSSGELIALWDADLIIPHSKWLSKATKVLLSFPKASTLWVYLKPSPASSAIAKAYSWFSWRVMFYLINMGVGFWGGGASILKKKAITDVGGITKGTDTGEDFDLAKKLSKKGYQVIFYRDAVYHEPSTTLTQLISEEVRRAKNFFKKGIVDSTGIPIPMLIDAYLRIGVYLALKNLFTKKKPYFGIVPIMVIFRLLVYAITLPLTLMRQIK